MKRSLRAAAATGVRWTSLSILAMVGAQLLQLYIATQIVSPEELGLYAVVLLVIGFLRIFADGGFTFGVLHRQEMRHWSKRYASAPRLATLALALCSTALKART